MRGIGRTLSRLPAARAFLAGAAFLASTAVRPGTLQAAPTEATGPDETAMAVPRVELPEGASGVGLPQPLSPSEAARVRRIFALQRAGELHAAVEETGRLGDDTLLGHILADRLIAAADRNAAPALADWLGRYADLPDAPAVYRLLLRASPTGGAMPVALTEAAIPSPAEPADEALHQALSRSPSLDASVLAAAHAGEADRALRRISRAEISVVYGAALRGDVAQALLALGRDHEALRTARDGWQRSQGALAQPAYVAGLATWRLGDIEAARMLFQAAATAPLATAATRAAASFWAARASLRLGSGETWRSWMLRAVAVAPSSFYGQIARGVLGLDHTADGSQSIDKPVPGEADVEAVAALSGGRRAFALLQVGEPERARAEFRLLWPRVQADPVLRAAVLLTVRAAGLGDLADEFTLLQPGGQPVAEPMQGGTTPVPRLLPRGGFIIDPAMVYGLARVESNFDAHAVSDAGAHGLMQIMPRTAGFVAGDADRYAGSESRLHDPALNLQLGQKYVRYLAASDTVHGDMLRLLASYNAGPNGTARWTVDDGGDPLMFIECIPLDETRNFVQRVLSFTWSYAERMKLPTPSREALGAGIWPRFEALH